MKKLFIIFIIVIITFSLKANEIKDTLQKIEALKNEISQNEILVEKKIADMKISNPLFAEKDSFESDGEYIARHSKAMPLINQIRKQYLDDLENNMSNLRCKLFETKNITIVLDSDKYDPNTEEWQIIVDHLDFQKEHYEQVIRIEKNNAKNFFKSKDKLIYTGILAIDIGDKIGLAKIRIADPVNDFEEEYEIQPMFSVKHGNYDCVNSVAFSPDGKFLATGSGGKTARIFNLETENEIKAIVLGSYVNSVTFSPDGKFLATGSDDTARIFNLETGNEVKSFECGLYVSSVAFSPDGKFLATGSGDKTARIFNLETGNEIEAFKQGGKVYSVAFSPDGKFLATGNYDGTTKIFNLETGNEVKYFEHSLYVYSVAFSPDGQFLATGSYDTARIFNLETGKKIKAFKHGEYVNSVAFSPDGKFLASGSRDDTARIFNLETGIEIKAFKHEGYARSVAFSPDGKYLAVGSDEASVYRTLFQVDEEIFTQKAISRPPVLSASESFEDTDGISKSKILNNIETAFVNISYSPLNDGTPRYLGISYDEGMTIEITGDINNVSKATFTYLVTDTYNENTIDHRMLIANRFLKNTVPEMNDTGGWLENKMTDAAGYIQSGYSDFEDTDYFGKKAVSFKFYKSLGICYVIVSIK